MGSVRSAGREVRSCVWNSEPFDFRLTLRVTVGLEGEACDAPVGVFPPAVERGPGVGPDGKPSPRRADLHRQVPLDGFSLNPPSREDAPPLLSPRKEESLRRPIPNLRCRGLSRTGAKTGVPPLDHIHRRAS